METLVKSLQEHFARYGFNIVEPFMVNDYNSHCKYKLNTFGKENAMGLIIGCNKEFWSYFEKYIQSLDEIPKNPMNSFCHNTIDHVLRTNEEIQKHQYDVRYDWNTVKSGKYAHLQTAGHFAGVAFYDRDVMWSIHPVYGLWFVYRAVVVFDVDFTGTKPQIPDSLFSNETKAQMVHWTNVAIDEGWSNLETRLKIRDVCPLGKEDYKYQGDTFDFFYPISRSVESVLESIRDKRESTNSSASTETSSATTNEEVGAEASCMIVA